MTLAIRATKLYMPKRPARRVSRGRLVERLNEGLERELTLIAAPAGFGKTTLVSDWLADYGGAVAWLSLDDDDNDPARFLTYLVAALQTASPQLGESTRDVLEASQSRPHEAVLTVMLNEIAARREPLVLVLDDYHVIDSEPVDGILRFLLANLPHQLHLVIATREDPRLPLSRLRAGGQLTELRAVDLRFTPKESEQFLSEVMGLDLTEDAAARLGARTEGWVAGLQLAALSLRGHEDGAEFIETFTGSHRFVLDYLMEEVLQRQPEQIRDFLLRTCILERLTGPLCDAVTGQRDGSAMLARLERGNFFVVPLDDHRRWYRYHRLFAEVLAAHALAEQGEERAALHLRASDWYERQDLLVDAVRHALAAEDFERAARLVELAVPRLRRSRQGATLLAWRAALPAEIVRARPVLSVTFTGALLNEGRLGEAEAHLQDVERWLLSASQPGGRAAAAAAGLVVHDEQAFQHLPASLAMYRAGLAQVLGDAAAAARHALTALELAPEEDHEGRGSALALLGLAAWDGGELETAYERFSEGMARLRRAGFVSDATRGMAVLADIRVAQGRLRDAMALNLEALRLAEERGEVEVQGSDLLVRLSELHVERDDLPAASHCLVRARELGRRNGQAQEGHRWFTARARVAEAQADLEGVHALLDEAERRYSRGFFPNVRPIAAVKARTWLAQGRLDEALAWAREADLSADDELGYLREYEHITLARALLARFERARGELHPGQRRGAGRDVQAAEATSLLGRLERAARAGGRVGSLIEILALQALAHDAQGRTPLALEALERALTLAEPEGYVRLFLAEGAPMARLLRASEGRPASAAVLGYRHRLLSALEAQDGGPPVRASPHGPAAAAGPAAHPDALVEALTARELEVLRLIAQGLSNREIAQRLHRAVSTIKGQNQVLFEKLRVGSRTEAIARGRELGLL